MCPTKIAAKMVGRLHDHHYGHNGVEVGTSITAPISIVCLLKLDPPQFGAVPFAELVEQGEGNFGLDTRTADELLLASLPINRVAPD